MIKGVHTMFSRDDIHKTVGGLKRRGVKFTEAVSDRGYGLVTHFKMPGGVEAQLHQPRYTKRPRKR